MNENDDLVFELYTRWKKLKGYNTPRTPIEAAVDQATSREEHIMEEFSEWFATDLLPRLVACEMANHEEKTND